MRARAYLKGQERFVAQLIQYAGSRQMQSRACSTRAASGDQVALVAGASRGLGLEYVKQLLERPGQRYSFFCWCLKAFPNYIVIVTYKSLLAFLHGAYLWYTATSEDWDWDKSHTICTSFDMIIAGWLQHAEVQTMLKLWISFVKSIWTGWRL